MLGMEKGRSKCEWDIKKTTTIWDEQGEELLLGINKIAKTYSSSNAIQGSLIVTY
jgi:hypothetical protein